MIWFWFLVAVLVIAFCTGIATLFYGCCKCCVVGNCCNSCSVYVCSNGHDDYERLEESEERRSLVQQPRPGTQEFYDVIQPAYQSISERAQNTGPQTNPTAAEVRRARRLMPFCKIFTYNPKRSFLAFRRSRKCKNDVCPICIEQFLQGNCLVLYPCKHAYHIGCLEGWFKVKGTCPLCNRPVRNEFTEQSPILYPFV